MIVLDEPYVSEPLIAWLEESQHPVLDSAFTRAIAEGHALNLVTPEEAARRIDAGERVYTNSENALAWIVENTHNDSLARHHPVQGQGGHARGARGPRPRPVLQNLLGGRAVQARLLAAARAVRAQALRGLLQHGRVRHPESRGLGARSGRHPEQRLHLARHVSQKRHRRRVVHPRRLHRRHRVRAGRVLRRDGPRAQSSTCCATTSSRPRTRATACTARARPSCATRPRCSPRGSTA